MKKAKKAIKANVDSRKCERVAKKAKKKQIWGTMSGVQNHEKSK